MPETEINKNTKEYWFSELQEAEKVLLNGKKSFADHMLKEHSGQAATSCHDCISHRYGIESAKMAIVEIKAVLKKYH